MMTVEANMENASTIKATPVRRWPFFFIGVLLFIAAPVAYAIQISLHRLSMPWYIPILWTVGVLLMALSVLQRRGIVRSALLVVFVLVCGFGWAALLGTKTPEYTGPAEAGQKLPEFAASFANGAALTNKDFEKGTPSVLLFFRGRW
jgi:hypothetical protein